MSDKTYRKEAKVENPAKGGEPREPGPEPVPPADQRLHDDEQYVEMTEEDRLLKERIEEAIEQVQSNENDNVHSALRVLSNEISQSTSSMTSVPKPLKFLLPYYSILKSVHQSSKIPRESKMLLADVISVVGMVAGYETRDTLHYRLLGLGGNIGQWGHEYIRHLAGEISEQYNENMENGHDVEELLKLVHEIVPYNMSHNAEAEAVDLLLETAQLRTLLETQLIDEHNRERVALYLMKCGEYLGDPEEAQQAFEVVYSIRMQQHQYAHALRVALRLAAQSDENEHAKSQERIEQIFSDCSDVAIKQQMALMLARHHKHIDSLPAEIARFNRGDTLKHMYDVLARELDTVAPKTTEDIYKSHLSETASLALRDGDDGARVQSAWGNLASSFVNGLVNCGYGTDTLMTIPDSDWINRNKDDYKISAVASLGLLHMWNADAISAPDPYMYTSNDATKAGALLAIGLTCTGIAPEDEPALAVLSGYLEEDSEERPSTQQLRTAMFGLALAYAGSGREDVAELFYPHASKTGPNSSFETACIAGLCLGLVLAGTANADASALLTNRLRESTSSNLAQPLCRHLCLGLALLFLGRGEAADAIEEKLNAIPQIASDPEKKDDDDFTAHSRPAEYMTRFAKVLLEATAYAGTGSVLVAQKFLHLCAEHPQAEAQVKEQKDENTERANTALPHAGAHMNPTSGVTETDESADDSNTINPAYLYQSAAVIGLALISLGEPLSVDMMSRMTDHLLQYGDVAVRRAVPLALGLCRVSDPDYGTIDVLSKLTHDHDIPTAQAAIFSMGICGAGTNNSRIAGLLRQLAGFYAKDNKTLFVTRLAQGLLHAGKGLVSLSPMHSDRLLLNRPALAGLMSVLLCGIDFESTLLGSWSWLMFGLTPALSPRMLMTVDADTLQPVNVEVRVGQAMETVGQAGKPKTITGFQTHNTPVLLSAGERAELVDNDNWTVLAPVLEGIVLIRKMIV